ncbi:MAG: class IV adenylate cyclase [Sedimentisphaerales bacterium]|nr:class IV adenylate cyclase [Sedimentisphaerales bacterium]
MSDRHAAMYVEIEAKLKVASLRETEGRLAQSGASFVREVVQTDWYFDTADRELTRADKCLRLRIEKTGSHERLVLAYKGPKEQDDYKRRQEAELQVNDAEAVELLFGGLGYRRALAFNKRRRLWSLGGCEVALDELPLLGAFVEIEGPDSTTIGAVQAMLGLSDVSHTVDSYACLIERELSRRGQAQREVYL